MHYRILGPLEVLDNQGQPIPLGGQREQVLLAALALEANRVVSANRLIEALWGEDPPATAANALQVHVSRLRKKLTGPSGSDGPLQTKPPGYVLRVGPGELDAERFEQLATASEPDEEPLAVSARLADALALWRGPVLEGLELDPSGRADACPARRTAGVCGRRPDRGRSGSRSPCPVGRRARGAGAHPPAAGGTPGPAHGRPLPVRTSGRCTRRLSPDTRGPGRRARRRPQPCPPGPGAGHLEPLP